MWIDGNSRTDFRRKCGNIQCGFGTERKAHEADATGIDLRQAAKELRFSPSIVDHFPHRQPVSKSFVDFLTDRISKAGIVAIVTNERPSRQNHAAALRQPGPPPLFWLRIVGSGGSPRDNRRAFSQRSVVGDKQQMRLQKVGFHRQFEFNPCVALAFCSAHFDRLCHVAKPLLIFGVRFKFAQNLCPLLQQLRAAD